ncbi:hypothetical protein SISSUDRAFT_1065864 [Sistotremastrum suecicum HHB10207 ss-3]|uniref:DUF6535 domain-containing protein n=1 Tax=Sistotremastrum suecicum HHB10207 ss-3 TaxID=1314776 RepID=A0A165Z0F9_9AGAM|nr:hypothetical protein SISSUDRAFT_1065864 [Sistotremastrum suecicum HHB10207 ss-3]
MSDSPPPEPVPEPTLESSRRLGRDADANTSTMALLTDQFSALLGAVNALNVTMNGIKTTLVDHGTKFDVLIRDALKNDQPYDEKALDDESTCLALYDMVVAKTKEKAEEWNGTIDVTLIFIALFSAVLTAFLVPATQALLPSSNDSTSTSDSNTSSNPNSNSNSNSTSTPTLPPLPARSDEIVCALYYLSLITAIVIAVLCALGRQWVRKLSTRPDVATWKSRTIWHVERMRRAEKWIKVLMEVLYWLLLASIGLFMTGLLFQLRNLATSFEGRATILLATWEVGVVLAAGIAATMIGTTYHAVRYEASVFEGLVSRAIVGDIDIGLAKGLKVTYGTLQNLSSRGWSKIGGAVLMKVAKRGWEKIKRMVGSKGERTSDNIFGFGDASWYPLSEPSKPSRWMRAKQGLRKGFGKGFEWMSTWRMRIKVNRDSLDELMNAYLELIADASDPILLERAAASFRYRDWVQLQHGDGMMDQLGKVYSRLMATDTSFRVRETVNAQISRFSAWIPKRRKQIEENRAWRAYHDSQAREGDEYHMARSKEWEEQARKEEEEERRATQLTKFLIRQRKDGISFLFNPMWENCADILDLISLPFDQFIAKCLCIHDHNTNLGDHRYIFFYSVHHCEILRGADKSDDVTRILSHVDLFSAVRSFVLADHYISWYDDVLKLIIGERRTEALRFLTEFLSTPRDWSTVDPTGVSSVFVIAAGSPPQSPSDLDLSPIIAHIGRHPSWENWLQASDTSIAHLGQCNISTMSDPAGVHHFLQQCVHLELPPPRSRPVSAPRCATQATHDAAQTLLHENEAFFISNILLPPSPPLSTSDEVISSDRRNSILDLSLLSDSEDLDETSSPRSTHILDDPGAPEITPLNLDPSESLPSSPSLSTGHHAIDMTDTSANN